MPRAKTSKLPQMLLWCTTATLQTVDVQGVTNPTFGHITVNDVIYRLELPPSDMTTFNGYIRQVTAK